MNRNPGRKAFSWPDALGADNCFLTSGSGAFPPPLLKGSPITGQPGMQNSCPKRKPEEGPGRGPKEGREGSGE